MFFNLQVNENFSVEFTDKTTIMDNFQFANIAGFTVVV